MKTSNPPAIGALLRSWRQRRRMSQLDLASEANISSKHLSFIETGRSQPSREMLLHLAEYLALPLREQNTLLTAAGYAAVFPERSLDDPALDAAYTAIRMVLHGHEPYPAMLVDRHWNLVEANRMTWFLLNQVNTSILTPPINMLRLSLQPDGLAPMIINLAEWRNHLFYRLRRQIQISADPTLIELYAELSAIPAPRQAASLPIQQLAPDVVPLQLKIGKLELSLIGTVMLFGTPLDVTISELAIEALFPANQTTALALQQLWQQLEAS